MNHSETMGIPSGWIKKGIFTLVYGRAGTGKTHLAYYAYLVAKSKNLDPVLIATEPGTTLFLRKIQHAEYHVAHTLDELVRLVTSNSLRGKFIIIDSVNWHYRSEPGIENGKILMYLSSVARSTGGLYTAQVSGEGLLPSGAPYIIPWAHIVIRTSKINDKFLAESLRPHRKTLMYEIRGKDLRWL
ncbi:MAG: AAA family ATPase [Desulfurococcales archaeon]|nr:AAA family ATPase [Desulfurococcales archaeon]MEB3788372.1 AAA family ATPase [Desulfurococcales archaeon]